MWELLIGLQDDRVDVLVGLLPGFGDQQAKEHLRHDALHVVETCVAPGWIETFAIGDLAVKFGEGGGAAGEEVRGVGGEDVAPGVDEGGDVGGEVILGFHCALCTATELDLMFMKVMTSVGWNGVVRLALTACLWTA